VPFINLDVDKTSIYEGNVNEGNTILGVSRHISVSLELTRIERGKGNSCTLITENLSWRAKPLAYHIDTKMTEWFKTAGRGERR